MLHQVSAIFCARLFGNLTQALILVVVAREAGVSAFGYVSVLVALVVVAGELIDFGFNVSTIRSTASCEYEYVAGFIVFGTRAFWLSSVVLGATTGLLTDVFTSVSPSVGLLVAGLLLERSSETRLCVSIALGYRWRAASVIASRRILVVVVFGVLVGLDFGVVESFALGQFLGGISADVGSTYMAKRLTRSDGARASLGMSLRYSKHFAINNLMNQARSLEIPIVALVSGPLSAGYYSAAARVINPILMLPGTIAASILSKVSVHGWDWVSQRARALGRFVVASVVFSCLLALAGYFSIPIVFGAEFDSARGIFVIMCVGLPFVILSAPLGGVLQGLGGQKVVSTISVVLAISSLSMLAIGGVFFGATGAAVAASVFSVVKFSSLAVALSRLRKRPASTSSKGELHV